jgi:hypothetical protein
MLVTLWNDLLELQTCEFWFPVLVASLGDISL